MASARAAVCGRFSAARTLPRRCRVVPVDALVARPPITAVSTGPLNVGSSRNSGVAPGVVSRSVSGSSGRAGRPLGRAKTSRSARCPWSASPANRRRGVASTLAVAGRELVVEWRLRVAGGQSPHGSGCAGRATSARCGNGDGDGLRGRGHRDPTGAVEADAVEADTFGVAGGSNSSPGRITPGSVPMTARFASYHAGHAREMSTAVALGPRCRAAMSHNVSPRCTT